MQLETVVKTVLSNVLAYRSVQDEVASTNVSHNEFILSHRLNRSSYRTIHYSHSNEWFAYPRYLT